MEHDSFSGMMTVNALAVFLIQFLKGSKYFPWLTEQTAKANKCASLVVSVLAASGVLITLAHTGTGAWTIGIVGLTLPNILHALAHIPGHYGTQKLLYKVFTSNNGAKA